MEDIPMQLPLFKENKYKSSRKQNAIREAFDLLDEFNRMAD